MTTHVLNRASGQARWLTFGVIGSLRRWARVCAGLALVLGTMTASAREVWVAPAGTARGDGSAGNPYDLATAWAKEGPVKPGDTVYLMGGRYDGGMTKTKQGVPEREPFKPTLSGTAEKPIVFTSAPGQWGHLNGTMELGSCGYLHFIRIEVGDLLWDPLRKAHFNGTEINTGGPGLKFINCNVFGGEVGFASWSTARDCEIYGSLIHDFGCYGDTTRGSGPAIYMRNDQGTKVVQHNIAYRTCDSLYVIKTQADKANGFDIIENIGYLGGYYKPGQVSFAFGLTAWQPSERIRFIGNVAYQPRDGEEWRSNMRLMTHYKPEVIHNDAVVRDNYIMGAYRAMTIGRWKKFELTGNTFWASGFLTELSSGPSGSSIPEHPELPDPKSYNIDGNTYYASEREKPFIYGRHEKALPGEQITFEQWQALGFDKNGRVLPGKDGKPTGMRVFVFPNKYEKGRGNVAVFNWDGKGAAEADLSKVLAPEQAYRVYNCLDIRQTIGLATPVLRSVYDGKPVTLPLRKAPECAPFEAFLVLPEWE